MPGDARPWNPTSWEEHIQRLLKKRYAHPVGSYQQIPADVRGDYGLEGFAIDGTVYQCYAAQNWQDQAQLLKKQKNKMTSDIAKLVKNENKLLDTLGDIPISLWNLVVPYWGDKDLLRHARKKESEVRALTLRHVCEGFRIAVITAEEFEAEAQILTKLDLLKFDSHPPDPQPSTTADWMKAKGNLELIANLSRKATAINSHRDGALRDSFLTRVVRNYIAGNILLGQLQEEHPDVYQEVVQRKSAREGLLEMECFATTKVPADLFNTTLKEYGNELARVSGISDRVADSLAREAVSDWLLRCPMEF